MIYLDTGCLLKLYYPDLEISNALELKLFRKEAKPSQVRATRALVEEDLRDGVLHRASVSWDDILADAVQLARTHTRAVGCRSLDILHCASARRISAAAFVTTDARQVKLARAIGLTCPTP